MKKKKLLKLKLYAFIQTHHHRIGSFSLNKEYANRCEYFLSKCYPVFDSSWRCNLRQCLRHLVAEFMHVFFFSLVKLKFFRTQIKPKYQNIQVNKTKKQKIQTQKPTLFLLSKWNSDWAKKKPMAIKRNAHVTVIQCLAWGGDEKSESKAKI